MVAPRMNVLLADHGHAIRILAWGGLAALLSVEL